MSETPDVSKDRSRNGALVHDAHARGRLAIVASYLDAGGEPVGGPLLCHSAAQAQAVAKLLREARTHPADWLDCFQCRFARAKSGDEPLGCKEFMRLEEARAACDRGRAESWKPDDDTVNGN